MTIEMTTVAKPWSSEARQRCTVSVDLADESVRVWDSVAGHFTTCHSLSAPSQRRLVARARKEW